VSASLKSGFSYDWAIGANDAPLLLEEELDES
jgi:hypothetical protein